MTTHANACTRELQEWKPFVTAGRSFFTILNEKTEARFTFKVTRKKGKNFFFVSVRSGASYAYIGCLFGDTFKITPKSQLPADAVQVRAFDWLNKIRVSPHPLPPAARFYHEGRCGRCGRRLTDPVSITRGIGPECWGKMGR